MEVCTIFWLPVVLYILSTLMIVNTSVNTCRNPNVKITTQSSDHSLPLVSSKAVDGCTKQTIDNDNCCSHTEDGHKEAWWQVDLDGLTVLEYVKIYYRYQNYQQRTRFGGYQIYQSNTSDWRNSYLCYKDTTPTQAALLMTPRINCTGTAQYLTIYSDRRSGRLPWYSTNAILELCEVEVYGCPLGKYGDGNCDSDCDVGCGESLCDPVTGKCAYCAVGYYRHGLLCIQCPSYCHDNVCNVASGVCFACTPGYYGSHCNQTCLFTCKDNQCKQSNGECEDCEDGFYGSSCNNCSVGCANRVCDKISGKCSPCNPGYYGDTCNTSCPSNCKGNICNQTSGLCTECRPGFHGMDCQQTCPENCRDMICVRNSGICSDCEDGFYGLSCDDCSVGCANLVCDKLSGNCSPCKPGYYGDTCNTSCPSNCKGNICNQTSGLCTECKPGFYGIGCQQTCPGNCRDSICVGSSGICSACEPSYFGQHCNMSCTGHCENNECRQDNGTCIACSSGYFGPDCEEECGQCSAISCSRSDGLCLCSDKTYGTCGCKNGWKGEQCIKEKAMPVSDDQTGTYAGAGVGAVIIIALVVIATVVILRRRRLPKRKKEKRHEGRGITFGNVQSLANPSETPDNQKDSGDTTNEERQLYVNVHDIEPKSDDDAIYKNDDVTGVSIRELQSIIDSKIANEAAAFKEEFQTFPWGAVHPHEAGKKTSNKPKNRFKTTFPYDHSRIILETNANDIDTSYINANYIDGIETEKAYIATQGPKENTLNDFWRMVWQVNSGKIVMVTNLVEGRNVCKMSPILA